MNKIFFFSAMALCLISFSGSAISNHRVCSSLTVQQDTLKYLNDHFISHKDRYLHKKLNVLLKDLGLPLKSYSMGNSLRMLYKEPVKIDLFFDGFEEREKKSHTPKSKIDLLIISFDTEVTGRQAMALYVKSFGSWNDAVNEFYGNLTVKDITVLELH